MTDNVYSSSSSAHDSSGAPAMRRVARRLSPVAWNLRSVTRLLPRVVRLLAPMARLSLSVVHVRWVFSVFSVLSVLSIFSVLSARSVFSARFASSVFSARSVFSTRPVLSPRFPRFSVCLALAIALGSATGAHAQTQPREPGQQTQVQLDGASMEVRRIGLIDLDGVVRRSNGTARVRELLDEQRELFQREFAAREIALQQTERELVARRDSLSEADFSARLADFEAEVVTIQQEIQYRRESIDIAFQDAQADIRRLAIDIVAEIAGELQLDLVLVRESALIFLPTLNISEAVLQRLDERTTNARFEISVDSDSPGGG